MTCNRCRAGGTANFVGDTAIAILFHAECEYIDCTCQHLIGEYVKK